MPLSYPSEPSTIGEHIKKKRIELKLLQSDVATLFKVSTDCITYWENDRSTPQIKYAPKIIDFLGYSPFKFEKASLSGRLKAYRWHNGLSCKKLGKILNVAGTTVSAWEKGKQLPVGKHLDELELYLNNSD